MLGDNIWKKLAESVPISGRPIAVRLCPESHFNIFAAFDPATGHRFLLLKSNELNLHPAGPLPSGRGFGVRYAVTPNDSDGSNCLQFELTETPYSDVFDVVGNDVLQNLLRATDASTAFATFVSRIASWQHFLDKMPQDGLSEQAQQGLFAELWFLREFLISELGPKAAVASWAGPKALSKDFQFTGLAFEVKASAAKQHTRLYVSNEMQLDLPEVGRLFVYALLLERSVAGGTSLQELVSSLRNLLGPEPDSLILFSELLVQSGYAEHDAARYTTRYVHRSEYFFEVKDEFPRIVQLDLRRGVGDVRYSILISECMRYTVAEHEVRALIRKTR